MTSTFPSASTRDGGSLLPPHLQTPTQPSQGGVEGGDLSNLPLGQRLLRAGLLTRQQLAQALREQQQNHLRLGEICLEHGWVDPQDLYRYTASHELCLGEVLVVLGHLNAGQLRVALAQQRRFGRRLGEILAWKGWVGSPVLEQALQMQVQLKEMQAPSAWEALQAVMRQNTPVSMPMVDPVQEFPVPSQPTQGKSTVWEQEIQQVQASRTESYPEARLRPAPVSLPYRQKGGIPREVESRPVGESAWDTMDDATYISELELQLQVKTQEWNELLEEMDKQIEDYRAVYEKRIQELETRLEEQEDQIQIKVQQDLDLRRLRGQVSKLEQAFQEARQEAQHARRQLEQALATHADEKAELQAHVTEAQNQLQARQKAYQEMAQALDRQKTENQVLQFQIETLAEHSAKQDPHQQEREQAQARQQELWQQQVADLQNQLSQAQAQKEKAQQEAEQKEALLISYRQTIQSLQSSLQDNLQEQVTAPSRTTGLPRPIPMTDPGPVENIPLTPWARNLFGQLQTAGLLSEGNIKAVLGQWQRGGGRLTQVLALMTPLEPVTIRFFCDNGAVAKQAGCRRLGDFLVAAGLVPQEVIKELRQGEILDSQAQAAALMERGVVSQATVDYFLAHFVTSGIPA